VDVLEQLGAFWIIGIAFNVSLAGLLIWWVLRQVKPREPKAEVSGKRPDGS
jgi:hypothetical protein